MIKYEIVATTGTYTDKEGNEKRRYENVGHVHVSQEGRFYITMKATFNPAGLPRKEGDDRVYLNLFEPKPKEVSRPEIKPAPSMSDMDEDIPW